MEIKQENLMEVKKETEENVQEISEEITEDIKEKYKVIESFCEDEEHFNNIISDLVMFEIVLGQINQIFTDTLYAKNSVVLVGAASDAIEVMKNTFSDEFISQTETQKELTSLPDLTQAVSWVQELHLNLATQLYTEDFTREVIAPAYARITEAIVEVSSGETENVGDLEIELPSDASAFQEEKEELNQEGN